LNKKKIINDPIYGFIQLPHETIYDLIQHPYFQRLRRIKQVGMTYQVYPGAMHTRYNHALGAMHLMQKAIAVLRQKGHDISDEEALGAYIAILLHDVGHGPFSHALEFLFIRDVHHEDISMRMMHDINAEMGGKLDTAIAIFQGSYPKQFLHQLVSSQLDMDRLDYLTRDSFFTGVSEGVVSWDRILNMLEVVDDQLVIEEKGIYSIEKFIVARRLMYWQVYLHKTVLSAEFMIARILKRAKELAMQGEKLFGTPALLFFLEQEIDADRFQKDTEVIKQFAALDDHDIFSALKVWSTHKDLLLAHLSYALFNRQLNRVYLSKEPFPPAQIELYRQKLLELYPEVAGNEDYLLATGTITNNAYNPITDRILILRKSGALVDVTELSDNFNLKSLAETVVKHYLWLPKFLENQA